MNRSRTWSITLGLGLIATALALPSVATATSGTVWGEGTAIIFDNGVHSSQGGGEVKSVSCFSAGNCTAVGEFSSPSTYPNAFTVSSVEGVWGTGAPTVFDSGIRNPTGESELVSVSCAAVGHCVAVGSYYDLDYRLRPFLVVSTAGTWGSAVPVTFPASVESTPPNSKLIAVDCTSTGNCTALGRVRTQNGSESSFTISSTSGTWGTPTVVTFPDGVLPPVHTVIPYQLSCASAGNCTVVGSYYEPDGDYQAFASTSVNGTWGSAETIEFPTSTLNSNAEAELLDVSCPAIGSCTATGYFANTSGVYLGFTVTATGGDWSTTRPEPAGHFPNAVHCASAGNCTVVGDYGYAPGRSQSYTATSTNGQWGSPAPVVFGAGVQNVSPNSTLRGVSCSSPGNCTAIGYFNNTDGANEGFTISSVDGVWTDARPAVFSTGTGNVRRPSSFKSVDCPTGGLCTVGGRFTATSGNDEIFVMSSNEAPPPQAPVIFNPPASPTTPAPVTTVPGSNSIPNDAPPPALSVIDALAPAPTPLVPVDRITVGSPITVSYGGFTPLEFVQLVVASTPQVIGSGFADSRGFVTLSGNLPTNLSSGEHTLAVYAPGSGVGFSQAITVASATLPVTGSQDSTADPGTATWMLAIGVVLIIAARQRRRI